MAVRRWIIVSALLLGVIAVAVYVVQTVVGDGYLRLERESLEKDVRRATSALRHATEKLDLLIADWATWDASYQFVQDRNNDYIQENLVDESLINTQINFIVYINEAGEVVYRKAFDINKGHQVGFPRSFALHLTDDSPLFDLPNAESSVSGILALPEGYLMVASHLITPSDRYSSPPNGTLVIGRYIDDAVIQMLTATTYLPIDLLPVDDPRIPSDVTLSVQAPIALHEVDDFFINGYGLITDLYGNPALAARIRISRDLYMQGRTTLMQMFIGLIVVSVVSAVLITRLNTRRSQLHQLNTDLEQRVQERTRELSEALKTKSQILANISHDARTPLNIITLHVQLLRRGADAKTNARLDSMMLSANQLLNFFDNLLTEAQSLPTAETTPLNIFAFPPEHLLENVTASLCPLARAKGLRIETQIDPALPLLLNGDLKRLEHIVSNLLSNAVKFTSEGGVIVRLARADETHWAIEVADTGRGIAPENHHSIFRPFWQVDSSMTRDTNRGVGLGLAVVQQLAARMGGQVRVESALGAGATFVVTLPLNLEGEKV